VALGQVFSKNFVLFPLTIYIPSASPQSSSLSPEAGTIGQEWPQCQQPHKQRKRKNCNTVKCVLSRALSKLLFILNVSLNPFDLADKFKRNPSFSLQPQRTRCFFPFHDTSWCCAVPTTADRGYMQKTFSSTSQLLTLFIVWITAMRKSACQVHD
jgi:hypothetical protein